MKTPSKTIIIAIASACILVSVLTYNRWKTSKATLSTPAEMPNMGTVQQGPVDRVAFLSSLFDKTKPPATISRLIMSDNSNKDSLLLVKKWAEETQNHALQYDIEAILFDKFKVGSLNEVARNLIFTGTEYSDLPKVSAYLFQQGKKWIDKGLEINSKNMELRNALIVYQSEYLNQPMQFLATLRESLLIDSNNIELHFIHLNLLKKSQQWEKAVKKCQKILSLQPQNPYWLYQMSEIYGLTGDSLNAQSYLNLAVKLQRKQNK